MRTALFLLSTVPLCAQTFNADILPVFEKSCIGCHAKNVKMGSLDLDTYEGVLKGGNHGQVMVPGKPEESRLYLMVAGKVQPAMPMGSEKLAAGDIEMIRKWIETGAKPGEPKKISEVAAPRIEPKVAVKPQVFALAYRPDGKTIALGGFKQVRLMDATTGKASSTLDGHAEVVRSVAFSKDGRLLAAAGGVPGQKGEVKIWNVDERKEIATVNGHDDCIYAVAFAPDGKTIATASYDRMVKLWDAATGKEVRNLKDHIDAVYAVAFTPDGKYVLSGAADRTIKVWDVATGQRLYTLGEPTDGINTLAVSPDGKQVVAGGQDKTIRVWSIGPKSGTLLHTLIAHEDAILRVAWSPDGRQIVSSAADRTIKLFNSSDLAELKSIPNQSDWTYGLEFSPDGRNLAAARYDGTLTIYPDAARAVPATTADLRR